MLIQLTKFCNVDAASPDQTQFALTGFSGPHAYSDLEWISAPESVVLRLDFIEDGDAPYTFAYSPGGFGPGLSIVGVDGTIGPAWSIPILIG